MYFGAYWALGRKRARFISKRSKYHRDLLCEEFHIGFEFTDIINPTFFLFNEEESIIFLLCKRKEEWHRKMSFGLMKAHLCSV